MAQHRRVRCPYCGHRHAVTKLGKLVKHLTTNAKGPHYSSDLTCPGSGLQVTGDA